MAKKKKREQRKENLIDVKMGKKNFISFGIGLFCIIVGFILLSTGSITIAPILLVLGYLVFFPLGILAK
jgi:hypothetical protein